MGYTLWLHWHNQSLAQFDKSTKFFTRANPKYRLYVESSLDINFATCQKENSSLIPLCGVRV